MQAMEIDSDYEIFEARMEFEEQRRKRKKKASVVFGILLFVLFCALFTYLMYLAEMAVLGFWGWI